MAAKLVFHYLVKRNLTICGYVGYPVFDVNMCVSIIQGCELVFV